MGKVENNHFLDLNWFLFQDWKTLNSNQRQTVMNLRILNRKFVSDAGTNKDYCISRDEGKDFLNNKGYKEIYINSLLHLVYDYRPSSLGIFDYLRLCPKPKKRDYKTYIFKSNNLFKIGRSTDIFLRHQQIHSMNPYTIIISTFSKSIELQLFEKFKHKNIYGDWFKLSYDDLKAIKSEFKEYVESFKL